MAASRNRKSPDPVTRLRQTLKTRLGDWLGESSWSGRRVAVAFSGGRDSTALLHAVAALRDETGILPSALHVNHGLSPHAERWVAFAENFCERLDLPLRIERVKVPEDSGLGLEGAARAMRYQIFARCPADLLLLGHHQDDQAETLLFNLLRGAGVHGAAAMPMLRHLPRSGEPGSNTLPLGRPWLDVGRRDIDAYISACGLTNIEDESNRDPSFSRNHLRHEILPRLGDRYPQAAASLAAAARRFGDAAALLDALADLDMAEVVDDDRLDCARLFTLDQARQQNLLRRWLSRHGVALSTEAGVIEFLRQCRDGSVDSQVAMSFGALSLRRWQLRIYRVREDRPVVQSSALIWRGDAEFDWCAGKLRMQAGRGAGLQAEALSGHIEVRSRQGSEALRLRSGGPSRPLRLLFQELGVPPWERQRLPCLWVGERLAAVGGIGIAAEFLARDNEPSVSFEWCPP